MYVLGRRHSCLSLLTGEARIWRPWLTTHLPGKYTNSSSVDSWQGLASDIRCQHSYPIYDSYKTPSPMSVDILLKDHHPQRSIALVTPTHTLIFRHSPPSKGAHNGEYSSNNSSLTSILDRNNGPSASSPRCMVELAELGSVNLDDYRRLSSHPCLGTLGLITLGGDIFICVITGAREVASVRPGEAVLRIQAVQFRKFFTNTEGCT